MWIPGFSMPASYASAHCNMLPAFFSNACLYPPSHMADLKAEYHRPPRPPLFRQAFRLLALSSHPISPQAAPPRQHLSTLSLDADVRFVQTDPAKSTSFIDITPAWNIIKNTT